MRGYLQDLRFSLRQFRKRPAFTAAAVLVLGLGLGANTAIFSVINALLLRPLPYRDTSRIVALYERNIGGANAVYNEVAPGTFADWQKLSTTFDEIGAYATGPITVGGPQGLAPQRVDAVAASRQLFTILGIPAMQGRAFTPEEDRSGADASRSSVTVFGSSGSVVPRTSSAGASGWMERIAKSSALCRAGSPFPSVAPRSGSHWALFSRRNAGSATTRISCT